MLCRTSFTINLTASELHNGNGVLLRKTLKLAIRNKSEHIGKTQITEKINNTISVNAGRCMRLKTLRSGKVNLTALTNNPALIISWRSSFSRLHRRLQGLEMPRSPIKALQQFSNSVSSLATKVNVSVTLCEEAGARENHNVIKASPACVKSWWNVFTPSELNGRARVWSTYTHTQFCGELRSKGGHTHTHFINLESMSSSSFTSAVSGRFCFWMNGK